VRLNIDTNAGPSSIRIGFTDQRLTAHGGMIVWSHFLQQQQFRHQLNSVLPHTPTSPNAFAPADIALGFLARADKLFPCGVVAKRSGRGRGLGHRSGDESVHAEPLLRCVLATFLSGFGRVVRPRGIRAAHAARGRDVGLPPHDRRLLGELDSWALLHEDDHQEGVAMGYTRWGLKPCHRSLIAALAESKLVATIGCDRATRRV